ncbi:NAD(P)H-dependent oxidoreductase [Hyphococcus luteus]|uniref:Dehydrogenase n=1 Tax=Hyphococcus luteus TaxID=2058213 RepID=A0A2S7K776_9PROT|nr:NAD(P)H-dependent oxidoreductase [Marinicaulis flavus]PQA88370.1 dehydrogenase [Marinicaulis flavus]
MAKNILIVQGHPDPAKGHLCHALADAYARGAREGGADVKTVEVAALDFPFLRSEADWRGDAPESLRPAIEDLRRADHFLFIYPLWMGTMPALLKAFLEQTFRPGVALGSEPQGFPKPGFKNKSARIAITMGMPALAYRWFFSAHSLKSLERNLLRLCGIKPIRETLFGLVEATGEEGWKKRMAAFAEIGRRDARP